MSISSIYPYGGPGPIRTIVAKSLAPIVTTYRISSTIDLALWAWVDSVTASGVTVIWDKQSVYGLGRGVKPPLPFVSLNIIFGPVNLSRPAIQYVSTDTFAYQFKKKFTMSVQVHALNGHMEIMDIIIDSLELPTVHQVLRASNLAFMSNTQSDDISALVNAGHQLRASAEFIFHYGHTRTDAPGQIDSLGLEGTFETGTGTLIQSKII